MTSTTTTGETRTFDLATALSLTTGVAMWFEDKTFGDMQEMTEHLLGRPVWTHEFARPEVYQGVQDTLYVQHPILRELTEAYGAVRGRLPEDSDAHVKVILAWRDEMVATHGETLDVVGGVDGRPYAEHAASAIASLVDMVGREKVAVAVID